MIALLIIPIAWMIWGCWYVNQPNSSDNFFMFMFACMGATAAVFVSIATVLWCSYLGGHAAGWW